MSRLRQQINEVYMEVFSNTESNSLETLINSITI